MNKFQSAVVAQHKTLAARSVQVTTPHGSFVTPTFMPVATYARVNNMMSHELQAIGSQIILGGNTYHMLLRPGLDVIANAGGMHKFMSWHGPMLTDSGGFQVFSLSKNKKICKIDDEGAHFKDPHSGKILHLNAETSLHAQRVIGADIIMAFDQCTPDNQPYAQTKKILDRTHNWMLRSKEAHTKNPQSLYGNYQALFGIIQGGFYRDLRELSTEFMLQQELDGIAIGGEAIGFDMQKTIEVTSWVRDLLPTNMVRYTMGVGLNPNDLLQVIKAGIDIFDCVAPTRNARHGALYCGKIIYDQDNWPQFVSCNDDPATRILIKKAIYAQDHNPIMPDCDCYTCQHHTRSYLHYLFKNFPHLYTGLASIHNVRVMHMACEAARAAIKDSAAAVVARVDS